MTKPWEHPSGPPLSSSTRALAVDWATPASMSDHCWRGQGFGSLEVVHPACGSRGGGSHADPRLDPVKAGIVYDFHHEWISTIKRALNTGVLPSDYYALAEQIASGLGPMS